MSKSTHQPFGIEVLEDRDTPVTITVNSLADSINVDGQITLREAIAAANSDMMVGDAPAGSGADLINFSVTGTITLSLGRILISDDLTITGPGSSFLSIDAALSEVIFDINNGLPTSIDVTISDITLMNGRNFGGAGGAIINMENLTLQNSILTGNQAVLGGALSNYYGNTLIDSCTFSGNYASNSGGAIDSAGSLSYSATLSIVNSAFSNNASGGVGGAIRNELFSDLSITGTTFTLNKAMSGDGGAISNYWITSVTGGAVSYNQAIGGFGGAIMNSDGSLHVYDATISGNTSQFGGGGIAAIGDASFTEVHRSTISGNTTSGNGGGIYAYYGDLLVENSTISGNMTFSSAGGGGVHVTLNDAVIRHSTITGNSTSSPGGGLYFESGTLSLEHTILSGNTGVIANDLHLLTTPTAANFNVIEKLNGSLPGGATGNIMGQSALLGPLANNGGPTLTHLPMAGSPAIDAGDPLFAGSPATDQRGFARVAGAAIDIGSVETGGAPACTVTAVMSGSDLIITGCPDDNVISISPSSGGFVVVFADSMIIGSFLNPARILIDAQAGNDIISVDPTMTIPMSIMGGDGDDTMLGAAGADTLIGGLGNDLYVFHDGFGLDTVIENVGEGFDTLDLAEVTTTFTYEFGGEELPSDAASGFGFDTDTFERLILGSGDDFVALRGDASAPGFAIDGGPGTDTLDYMFSTLTGSVNLSGGVAPGFSSVINFENVVGLATAGASFGSASESVLAEFSSASDVTRRHTAGSDSALEDDGLWI